MKVKANSYEVKLKPYSAIIGVLWLEHGGMTYRVEQIMPREIERMHLQYPEKKGVPRYFGVIESEQRLLFFPRNERAGQFRINYVPPEDVM